MGYHQIGWSAVRLVGLFGTKRETGTMKPKALGLAAIAAVTFASPMFAQRYLNYDTTKSITMTGTVVGLDWMNPNNELYVRAKDPATDKDEQFVFLMAPPTRSTQLGWKPNTLKPGDT